MATAANKIPSGYKQTEVGVIPEDWEVRKLRDGINLLSGHHVLTKYCNTEGNGFPYITGPADFPSGTIQHSKFTVKPTTICRTNDILVTVKGSGAGSMILADAEYSISRQLMAIRVTNWNTSYIYYSLIHDESVFGAVATGLIPGLSRGDILNKVIPLPPTKVEQAAIATALSDTNAFIEKLKKLIEKKNLIKQGAMQELLTGKRRLPGFSSGWKDHKLGNLANIKTGSRNNQDKIEDGKYPFFVRSSNIESINSYSYDCEAILVPGEGNIGNIFHYIKGRFDVHQRVYAITNFNKDVSGKFLFYYMVRNFGAYAMKNTVKATVDSLRLPTFENFILSMPSQKEEQNAIANVLSDMDTEIEKLESQLAKYREIKQGMMQTLLTGKIRLI